MQKILRQIATLEAKIEALARALEVEREKNRQDRETSIHMLKTFRAAIVRLEDGTSGEMWHVGGTYTRGSRLRIPPKPWLIEQRDASDGRKRTRKRRAIFAAIEAEEITNGVRHGIPPIV